MPGAVKIILEQCRKRPLLSILLFSFFLRLAYLLVDAPLWWDSYVYIGVGKYIFSDGMLGMWEPYRPLLHPFLLGVFWKLGFNPVTAGTVLDIIFSLTAIGLTYALAKKMFGKKAALLSALLLSVTPFFLQFTGKVLTDPLALTLSLLGLLLLSKRREGQFFAGLVLSLAFLTRFPHGIWFAGVFLIHLFRREELLEKTKTMVALSAGFLIPLVPYAFLNYHLYGDVFLPFRTGTELASSAVWLYGAPAVFYLTEFFLAFPIYLFFWYSLAGCIRNRTWNQNYRAITLTIIILTLLYFQYLPRKEIRYMATALPLLALWAGYGTLKLYRKLHQKPYTLHPRAFLILAGVCIVVPLLSAFVVEQEPSFQQQIENAIQDSRPILTSSPVHVALIDHPFVTLSGMEFARKVYTEQKGKYGMLALSDCDFLCSPDDDACQKNKKLLLQQIAEEHQSLFQQSYSVRGEECTFSIYRPVSSP